MERLVLDALMVVLALFLVALNGLFVAAEFAFVKIRATQVDRLVREGRPMARLVEGATRRLDATSPCASSASRSPRWTSGG